MKEVDMLDLLPNLEWPMLCYEYGKLDDYLAAGYKELFNDYYESFFDVISIAADFVNMDYKEYYGENKFYFGFRSMSEYYRLCRDYCNARHVSLKHNPYMAEARKFVDTAMDLNSYGGYGYMLQTKVNHEWASGLLVLTDESYFNAEYDLAEALFRINAWYIRGVERLKTDLAKQEKEVICA